MMKSSVTGLLHNRIMAPNKQEYLSLRARDITVFLIGSRIFYWLSPLLARNRSVHCPPSFTSLYGWIVIMDL